MFGHHLCDEPRTYADSDGDIRIPVLITVPCAVSMAAAPGEWRENSCKSSISPSEGHAATSSGHSWGIPWPSVGRFTTADGRSCWPLRHEDLSGTSEVRLAETCKLAYGAPAHTLYEKV